MSSLVHAKCTSSVTAGRTVSGAERGGRGGETLLEQVLHRLDVVHGDALGRGELGDGVLVEVRDDPAQVVALLARQRRGAGDHVVAGQVDEPLDLDVHAARG